MITFHDRYSKTTFVNPHLVRYVEGADPMTGTFIHLSDDDIVHVTEECGEVAGRITTELRAREWTGGPR